MKDVGYSIYAFGCAVAATLLGIGVAGVPLLGGVGGHPLAGRPRIFIRSGSSLGVGRSPHWLRDTARSKRFRSPLPAGRYNGRGQFTFSWKESGGPTVASPTRRGFGSAILLEAAQQFGSVTMNYLPKGLIYQLQVDLTAIEVPKNVITLPITQPSNISSAAS